MVHRQASLYHLRHREGVDDEGLMTHIQGGEDVDRHDHHVEGEEEVVRSAPPTFKGT